MQKELEAGSKVEYRLYDKRGKEHWLKGVIHAVRRYEDPATNTIIRISYLIDTGREHPDHVGRVDRQPEQIELPAEHIRTV